MDTRPLNFPGNVQLAEIGSRPLQSISLQTIKLFLNAMTINKTTGVIAGNFDVIHPGYIHLFNECKEHCNTLLLLLHEDPSIERKQKLKPILTLEERILILSSLRQVDEIISYKTEAELLVLLKSQTIDVRFLGDDYQGKEFTGMELNIPIHYLERSHGWSTTKYKELLAKTLTD